MASVTSRLFLLAVAVNLTGAGLPRRRPEPHPLTLARGAMDAILATASHPRCYVILFLDWRSSATTVFEEIEKLRAPSGVAVFEVTADGKEVNVTQEQLSRLVGQAQQLRQLSWCLTMVVVSDDPAFLAAFAERSHKVGLLVWQTKLLIITRLPLPQLRDLYMTFSMTNSMLLIVDVSPEFRRFGIYLKLPYILQNGQVVRVASWTPQQGLVLTTHLPLFPDKFSRFISRPTLRVAAEVFINQRAVLVDDPNSPGRQLLTFVGPMANVLDYLSKGTNFSYQYVRSADGAWGAKLSDGSWSGMVGMVSREAADIGLGPFGPSISRDEVVDFTWPVRIDEWRILGGRGRPEVDPWGFLLPLAPLVWAAILTTLLLLPVTVFLLSSCFSFNTSTQHVLSTESTDTFSFIRILFQQDMLMPTAWWWERLVLGVWMMMTLVLTRSYAGNLMSLLAVRHIPQPYHTLRDVLDDSSVAMIWLKSSVLSQYFRYVKSGIFREVGDLDKTDRLIYKNFLEFPTSADTLVRPGHHVLVDVETNIRILMAQDFSHTGRCDFYISRGKYLSSPFSMIVKNYNPLGPVLSRRIMTLMETGLVGQWLKSFVGNSTACSRIQRKIVVTTTLSLTNLWGVFVVLGAGLALGLLVMVLEAVAGVILHSSNSSLSFVDI